MYKKQLITIFVIMPFLYSFNWDECKRWRQRHRNFIAPTTSISSSTSFFSSTGECAMIGIRENDSKVYLVHNFEKMKDDFAKGDGEYAKAFYSIHNCDASSSSELIKRVKNNFKELLKISDEEEIYHFLTDGIHLQTGQVYRCDMNG